MSVVSRNGHQSQRHKKVMMSDLRQLIFAPKVVALIGVSNDPKKLSSRPLQFCQQHKFAGKLYLVNPRHNRVLGQAPDYGEDLQDITFLQIYAADKIATDVTTIFLGR